MRSPQFEDAFNKLAAAEARFLASEFLAPALGGGEVHVRIAGVINRLRVSPPDFRGFGVFRPTSPAAATLVRPATLTQRREYLALFPLVRLILCRREEGQWLALPAHRGDQRLQIAGLAPLRMAEEAQQFDIVRARFDGTSFWFESLDSSRDPATAAYLRQQFAQGTEPHLLQRAGLTPEERLAYTFCLIREAVARQPDAAADPARRLRDALAQAGAELVDYLERGDGYRVTYTIGGQQHVSAVRKDDLTIQVAGICLSGLDGEFDLTSLVGVLREAGGGVLRIGDEGMEEETVLARASTTKPLTQKRAAGNAVRGVPGACEECWPLVGERRGRLWFARKLRRTVGSPASVEFDGPAVLAREEKRRDIVGFLHTHPGFPAELSRRDIATMQAWVSAFGKPLLCLIHGTDGLAGYVFASDDSRGERLAQVESFARDNLVVLSGDSRNATEGVPYSSEP